MGLVKEDLQIRTRICWLERHDLWVLLLWIMRLAWFGLELGISSDCCSAPVEIVGRVTGHERCRVIQRIMRVHGRGPIFINVDIEFRINAFS